MDRFNGRLKLIEERFVMRDLIAGHSHNDNTHFQFGEILLTLEIAIDRDEHIKPVLREREQRTVFATSPTNLRDGRDDVPAECAFHTDVNALV